MFGWVSAARADVVIEYARNGNDGAGTGNIAYAGGAAALVGTNIQYDTIDGLITPANQGSILAITGGKLNFTTGTFDSSTSSSWNFKSGATITLTGAVLSLGITNTNTVLLSGYFNMITTVAKTNGNFKVQESGIFDHKNVLIEQYYGINNGPLTWSGSMDAHFTAVGSPPGSFSSTLIGTASIFNTAPEPSSMAIAGLGALGLIGYGIRRRRGA